MAVPDFPCKHIREMTDAEMFDSIANGAEHCAYPHAFLRTGLTNDQITGLLKRIRQLENRNRPCEGKQATSSPVKVRTSEPRRLDLLCRNQ
jgi:hypothetical protein